MDEGRPIFTADRFGPLHEELIGLLRGLAPAAWQLPTSAGSWTVRDVAAHLLDGDVRRISVDRDAHMPAVSAFDGYEDLVAWLDGLNAVWVAAARRMSPRLLTDLLELTGAELARVMEATDPFAPATFPVAWAGDRSAPAWLDVGREYTERWHHQDQIREAVGATPLAAPEWLQPVIAVSLRAVPHGYARFPRPAGTTVSLLADGPAGGAWSLTSDGSRWRLHEGKAAVWTCHIEMNDLALARLLLHRLPPEQMPAAMRIAGDAELAAPLQRSRAVMVSARSAGVAGAGSPG